MKRADRCDGSDDNSKKYPRSKQSEPMSPHEAKQRILTLRSQKDELQEQIQEQKNQVQKQKTLYFEEQQKYQNTLVLYQEEQHKYQTTLTLYQEAQAESQSFLSLYNQEQEKSNALQIQVETVQTERDCYLNLYNEAQTQLKFERRSKAGIKSWETRRKKENEVLKREIAEMTMLLKDSLVRKEEAISHLEEFAERMDRIQHLVNAVESDSTDNPMSLLQKFRRIWQAIQEILAE
ncbi:hypothetical protein [Sphaerothrix gracilis]|uniref:hypothetical protein n=1 Tax=Sphaerothrix gracilis TaxID=3151835 RepID=UPI0031FCAC4B